MATLHGQDGVPFDDAISYGKWHNDHALGLFGQFNQRLHVILGYRHRLSRVNDDLRAGRLSAGELGGFPIVVLSPSPGTTTGYISLITCRPLLPMKATPRHLESREALYQESQGHNAGNDQEKD